MKEGGWMSEWLSLMQSNKVRVEGQFNIAQLICI